MIFALRQAGQNALAKQPTVRAKRKGAKDIVTAVDHENEANIRKALRKVDPSISFLGEEGGLHTGSGVTLAVVDPLDATTNYARLRKEFSIMGAILEGGVVQFAAIMLPAFDELIVAERDNGAFLLTPMADPVRLSVSTPDSLADAVISCNRSNYPEGKITLGLNILKRLMRSALSWRNLGTAGFEYSDVARGRLDGIVTPIAEAVHIAGYLVMEEAGARVTDERGNHYSLESKAIVAASPRVHDELLRMLEGIEF